MTTKYGWLVSALFVFMAFSFSTATLHAADCPSRGSGKSGVDKWASSNVGEDCDNPATTCNGEYTIELTDHERTGNLVTFTWMVCSNGPGSLSHWGFSPNIDCQGEGFGLLDLIHDASIDGVSALDSVKIGLDPTTQIDGIKFDKGVHFNEDNGNCVEFSITFDISMLESGKTLGIGCTLAATKQGNQDIRMSNRVV